MLLLDINIVVVYLLTYISQSADYLRVRSSTVPSVACQTTEGEYLLLTISYLLIPCSYLQVYTNITVACQTTEVTYRSFLLPSYRLHLPCADHHLSTAPWVLHLSLACPELVQGAKAMSGPGLKLEPLGQFPASRNLSWLQKCSTNSGLLSCTPDLLRMPRDYPSVLLSTHWCLDLPPH